MHSGSIPAFCLCWARILSSKVSRAKSSKESQVRIRIRFTYQLWLNQSKGGSRVPQSNFVGICLACGPSEYIHGIFALFSRAPLLACNELLPLIVLQVVKEQITGRCRDLASSGLGAAVDSL